MSAEITIVGAGIIGLCCGLALQESGYHVRIIDSSRDKQNCSKGNAGHFATEQVSPLASWSMLPRIPGMMLDPLGPLTIRPSYMSNLLPWFARFILSARASASSNNRDAIYRLNSRAIAAWERLLRKTKGLEMIEKKGHLLVFEGKSLGRRIYKKQESLARFGVSVRALVEAELKEFEPNLAETLKYGIYYPDTASTLSPIRLMSHLRQTFIDNGGDIAPDRIEELRFADSTFFLQGERSYESTALIIAAGAWSHRLAEQVGYAIPLETERGYHAMLSEVKNFFSRPVASFERSFIMSPMKEGLRLAGTVELAGVDAEPNYRRADLLLKHAKSICQLPPDCEVSSRWMGCRPSLPDSLPVLGPAPTNGQLFFAFGHQHLGLTQAAITGELIADAVTKKTPAVDLYPYRCNRF